MGKGKRWQRWFWGAVLMALVWKGLTFPAQSQSPPSPWTQQGQQIQVAGKTYPVAWGQWSDQGQVHTALSDTGAMQWLGMTLLDNDRPDRQPVDWFTPTPMALNTRLGPPHRYVDVTPLLDPLGSPQPQGNTLILPATQAQITGIREGNQPWGKRVVMELTQPAYWQVSQAREEAVVAIAAESMGRSANQPGSVGNASVQDDDDLGGKGKGGPVRYRVEADGAGSKLIFQMPAGQRLQVSTLANPYRLVIDVRPDAPSPRQIRWTEGLTWHQQWVALGRDQFPVTFLELDRKSPTWTLRPLLPNDNTVEGISPLVTLSRTRQATAAINAGFFNRNTQLPLGALKTDNTWLSGPILNRGAIAWNDQGQFQFGRLTLGETLTTANGQRISLTTLNSGYPSRGVARYTPAWGPQYRSLTDNETAYVVQRDQITAQYPLGKAGQLAQPIPADGYLLIDRGNTVPSQTLAQGTSVTVTDQAQPAVFDSYPHTLAAGPLLIHQGRMVLNAEGEKFSAAFQQQRASRSAIALDNRDKVLLVAVHNRVGGTGPTLGEWAQLLRQLGAVEALNLDGGSSTSLTLGGQLLDRSPVTAARVNNGLGIFLQ